MNNPKQLRYFAYLRKSTEQDEQQVHSIDDQRTIVTRIERELGLHIVHWFQESQSARKLGRPVFAEMLSRIEAGEANAVIGWHPDRLARNSLDGARIIQLLDDGKLQTLAFASFTFENTSIGKFNLGMAFVQSKYYTDNQRENVKRGIDLRLEKGIYPNRTKRGYIRDKRTSMMIPDPATFHLISELYDLYLTGRYSQKELGQEMYRRGLASWSGKPYTPASIYTLLTDPFYAGGFYWHGEHFRGIHQPAVSLKQWKAVQVLLRQRTRKQPKHKSHTPFAELIRCGGCGYAITAEEHTKHMKSGKVHHWTYYRCTKKGASRCSEPFIREEALLAQIQDKLAQVALPDDWAEPMLAQIDTWEAEQQRNISAEVSKIDADLESIAAKLRRLRDLHVDGEMDREEFRLRKQPLVASEIALTERRRAVLTTGVKPWLEPLRACVKLVWERNIAQAVGDLEKLRDLVAEVGSNLSLISRNLLWNWHPAYAPLARRAEYVDWWAILDSNQ